jgi:hypothetical protein
MRNNVPGGGAVSAFPPPGVATAGGATGESPIERLRIKVKALEQVPVSLAFSPASGSEPSRPACSFFSADEAAATPCLSPLAGEKDRSSIGREGGKAEVLNGWITPLLSLPHKGGGKEAEPIRNPLERFKEAGLHEIKPQAYPDEPAALAFALALLSGPFAAKGKRAPLLWCLTDRMAREWGAPYGPGLCDFGLDPAELLIVQTNLPMEAAWALEEGLKARAFIAALGQFEVKAPLVARRLSLAAQASRTPCLLLSGHRGAGLPGTLTRWRIEAARSRASPFDASAPGAPIWRLTLERCRGMAPTGSWIVEFRNDAYGVHLDAALSDREAEAGERRQASG